jgi:regulatory protein
MIEESLSDIYNKSLDIISRREHSEHELTNKLLKKFKSHELIDAVVEKLKINNLVNDERYAEIYVRIRKRKGFGPKKIIYELSVRGISNSISSNAILDEGGWKEIAKNVFNKKYKDGVSSDYKDKSKQKSFLQNRGFSFQEIDSVIS